MSRIGQILHDTSGYIHAVLEAGSAIIGKMRLVTATGDEVTDDTADAVKAILQANDGVDVGDVGVKDVAGVTPQFDDTDKLAVSLYGKGTAAADTELTLQSANYPNLRTALYYGDNQVITRAQNSDGGNAALHALFCEASLKASNGSTLDRFRNNTEATLLASAARTSTTNSADQTNFNARGVLIVFDVTAAPGVDTVTLSVEAKDPVSGKYVTVLDGSAQSATGTYIYAVYPSCADTEAKFDTFEEMPLPRTWRVKITHSGTGEFTYSVGAMYVL